MKKIVVVLVPILLMACASTPKTDSSQVSQSKANSASAASSFDTANSATAKNAETESKRLAAEIRELQNQSVYFDFDKFAVKPEYLKVIQQQAAFIKAHSNDVVTVQGNADERGSDEYNLALGDRRANAARKNLELMGIPATQIKSVSLGEEKPHLLCHEEKCWKENRRDDFVHKLN
jgi:peptidoglycan-associated lipoprotein